jgi:transposase
MSQTTYDESFKKNAVSLVEAGTPASRVARDLGISDYLVRSWYKKYGTKASTHGNALHNQDEVTQLRKQAERHRAEMDILKKALGIFSRPTQ